MNEKGRYFDNMKELAREKRELYRVNTAAFGLREVRTIYKAESIKIDQWKLPAKIKALYMCEDGHCSVAVQPKLPREPKLFALMHELKHHFCDQDKLNSGELRCGSYNEDQLIEIGAEVFAAEFVYPEAEFHDHAVSFVTGGWSAEDIVRFKRQAPAHVSYTFIRKRLEWFKLIQPGQFQKTQFTKLEEELFGPPIYKQAWFRDRRRKRGQRTATDDKPTR